MLEREEEKNERHDGRSEEGSTAGGEMGFMRRRETDRQTAVD
jgi:hypothetical protein